MASISIRPMEAGDRTFIIDSGHRSIRKHPIAADMEPGFYGIVLGALLDKWTTIVAVDPDEPAVVLGWLVYRESKTVGWAFTKPWWRGRGVQRALFEHAGIGREFDLLFPTRTKPKRWRIRFRPYLTFGPVVFL